MRICFCRLAENTTCSEKYQDGSITPIFNLIHRKDKKEYSGQIIKSPNQA